MLQQPTVQRGTRQLQPRQLGSLFAGVIALWLHPIGQNNWGPFPSGMRLLGPCALRLTLRIPAFVLLVLNWYMNTKCISRGYCYHQVEARVSSELTLAAAHCQAGREIGVD